ncbi:MAG: ATP-binding cassette domain-containing protein [Acidobacteriaceae bacterium]
MPAVLEETATRRYEPKPDAPTVVFENVSIAFDRNEVLKDISFRVKPGETRLLLGPAGGGKSVLLKLANGLIRPDSGRIFVFGHEITAMQENEIFELRSSVGMVFQEGALFDSLNIRDNVGFQLMERHVPDHEIDQRVEEALKFVELDKTMEKFPSELSGGMRRRVAIARAIISKPSLLLYDSPTGGLDPITSTNIVALIMKQRDVYHTSSILITHRLQDAFMLATHYFDRDKNTMVTLPSGEADRDTSFMVLHEGKLVFDGSTHDLVHSDDTFLKEYLT